MLGLGRGWQPESAQANVCRILVFAISKRSYLAKFVFVRAIRAVRRKLCTSSVCVFRFLGLKGGVLVSSLKTGSR